MRRDDAVVGNLYVIMKSDKEFCQGVVGKCISTGDALIHLTALNDGDNQLLQLSTYFENSYYGAYYNEIEPYNPKIEKIQEDIREKIGEGGIR